MSVMYHFLTDNLLITLHLFISQQVCGKVPLKGCISPNCRNKQDNGIQCCRNGPDKWAISSPQFKGKLNIQYQDRKLSVIAMSFDDIIVDNPTTNKAKKRKLFNSKYSDIMNISDAKFKDTIKFQKLPNVIPDKKGKDS